GFSPVRLEGWLSKRCLPGSPTAQACSRHTPSAIRFASALRAPRGHNGCPALGRAADSIAHHLGGLLLLPPGGPGSGPGYTLNRPPPSHSWANRDFTAWRLIRDAFALRERLGDP